MSFSSGFPFMVFMIFPLAQVINNVVKFFSFSKALQIGNDHHYQMSVNQVSFIF